MRWTALSLTLTLVACGSDTLAPFASDASTPLDGSGGSKASTGGRAATDGTGGASGGETVASGGKAQASEDAAPSASGGALADASVADGSVPPGDAAVPTDDAEPPLPEDAGTCAQRTVFYLDKDGDGFGNEASVFVGCTKPTRGKWADVAGDCNDANADVHPGQKAFFGAPHTTAGGVSTFDYDCSGAEQPDPAQPLAPTSCGLLSLALCAGSGHAKTARTGTGVNAYCGSNTKTSCQAAALGLLVCEAITLPTEEPFRCR